MIIVKPELVDDSVLTSNIVEPDLSRGESVWNPYRGAFWSEVGNTTTTAICHYSGLVFAGNGSDPTKIYSYTITTPDQGDIISSELFTLNAATGSVVDIAYNKGEQKFIILDSTPKLTFYDSTGSYLGQASSPSLSANGGVIDFGGGYIHTKYVGASSKPRYHLCYGFNQSDFVVGDFFSVGAAGDDLTSPMIVGEYLFAKIGLYFYRFQLFVDDDAGTQNPDNAFAKSVYSSFEGVAYLYEATTFFSMERFNKDLTSFERSSKYVAGDISALLSDHSVYQCLVDSTLDRPDIGAAKETPTWLKLGSTNKYAMFDGSQGELNSFSGIISNQTESDSTVNITLAYPVAINSVCGFNIENCTTVEVTISGGTAYNETITLGTDKSFSLFGLNGTTVTLEFIPSSGTMKIGEVVAGVEKALGESNFGGSLGLLDFSRVETDSFGNVSVTPRRKVKIIDYDVTIDTDQAEDTFSFLSGITTVPAVYAAESDFTGQALVAFAIYQDFRANIESPEVSSYTLSVQGLV